MERKDRIKLLKKYEALHSNFLDKSYKLLLQFKKGGIGHYLTREDRIFGLTNSEINDVYYLLNSIYNDKEEYSVFNVKQLTKTNNGNFMEREFVVGGNFEKALSDLEFLLNNKKEGKKEEIIKNLKKPIVWENISIIYSGESIKIKQNDTPLGGYFLDKIGIPKNIKSKGKNSRQFFISIFFNKVKGTEKFLSVKTNINQKHKSKVSQILKKVFDTNIDPFYINKERNIYLPRFSALLGSDLKINDFSSGREFNDGDSLSDDYNYFTE